MADSSSQSMALNAACAALLAATVRTFFPNVSIYQKRAWQNGFFVTCSRDASLDEKLLPSLMTHMHRTIRSGIEIEEITMMRQNAIAFFEERGMPLLVEQLSALKEKVIELYRIGDVYDSLFSSLGKLCDIKEFVLTDIEKDASSLKIHGAAFASKEQKKAYCKAFTIIPTQKRIEEKKLLRYQKEHAFLLPDGKMAWDCLVDKIQSLLQDIGYVAIESPRIDCVRKGGKISLFDAEQGQGPSDTTLLHAMLFSQYAKVFEYGVFTQCFDDRDIEVPYEQLSNHSCRFHSLCTMKRAVAEITSILKIFVTIARMVCLECVICLKVPRRRVKGRSVTAMKEALQGLAFCEESEEKAVGGPRIVFYTQDWRGRQRAIAMVGIDEAVAELHTAQDVIVAGAVPSSFEALLGVLIEKNSGCGQLFYMKSFEKENR